MKVKPHGRIELVEELSQEAHSLGLRIYAVGGCVRDWLLGKKGEDIDFLLNGPAEGLAKAICSKYGGIYQVFSQFQTVRCFLNNGSRIDFASFRREIYTKPAALPKTEPAKKLEEDLLRRDFTVNAMAVELTNSSFELTDIFGGREDLTKGIIRALHEKSFSDDPTRIFRAARFAGRFDWQLHRETEDLIYKAINAGYPDLLSRERLRNELIKILSEAKPSPALEVLHKLNALQFIYRALDNYAGIDEIKGLNNRLAFLAKKLGVSGADFILSLKLSKKQTKEILALANK